MEPKLIKIDRNGSKHYEGLITCDRCGGRGLYAIGVHNGQPVITSVDGGICHKCLGKGKVLSKWIERTPEYQAKLDAKREAKWAKIRAEQEAEYEKRRAEREEQERKEAEARAAEEARIRAQKAISQYIGEVGQRIEVKATLTKRAHWDTTIGWKEVTMYAITFKDEQGNALVWKTQSGCYDFEEGDQIILTGTIKRHSEYKDEKQTELQRCKLQAV